MKNCTRNMIVLLAIIFSLVTVSTTWAKECNITMDGVITEIVSNGAITVFGTYTDEDGTVTEDYSETFYGIPLIYLDIHEVGIYEGDSVVITGFYCNVYYRIEACTITRGTTVIELPGNRGL